MRHNPLDDQQRRMKSQSKSNPDEDLTNDELDAPASSSAPMPISPPPSTSGPSAGVAAQVTAPLKNLDELTQTDEHLKVAASPLQCALQHRVIGASCSRTEARFVALDECGWRCRRHSNCVSGSGSRCHPSIGKVL